MDPELPQTPGPSPNLPPWASSGQGHIRKAHCWDHLSTLCHQKSFKCLGDRIITLSQGRTAVVAHYIPQTKERCRLFHSQPYRKCPDFVDTGHSPRLPLFLPAPTWQELTQPSERCSSGSLLGQISLPLGVILRFLSHHVLQPWYLVCWCPLPDRTITHILVLFFLLGVHFLKIGSIVLRKAPMPKTGLCSS